MSRARLLALMALVAAVGSVWLDAGHGFGRIALRLGAPQLADALFTEPYMKGMAEFEEGAYAAAEDDFRRAGPRASYNRGAALALDGRFGASVAAYDAVISRNPEDIVAMENRAVVFRLWERVKGDILPGTEGVGDGTGDPDAASPFDEAVASDGGAARLFAQRRSDHAPTPALARSEGVLRPPEARGAVANRRWLATFPDDPGLYLRAIVAAEHARRAEAGIAPETPVVPW